MISAIVLAAGLSSRMGNANKLLLPYLGRPVIYHVVSRLMVADPGEIIVVLGHEADDVRAALAGLPLTLIVNSKYREGMTSSIQAGVSRAAGDGFMICLSDMYAITSDEYREVISSFNQCRLKDIDSICMPRHKGRRGNPVVFSSTYRESILKHEEPDGCKEIVAANSGHLFWMEMVEDHVLQDLDYPEDYGAIHQAD